MSTVQQLIDKIKLHYPNTSSLLTTDQIIDIMNDVQREVFRELQLTDTYEFTTIADQPIYALGSNIKIEFIKYLGITTDTTVKSSSVYQEYTFADLNETMTGYRYFDAHNGNVGIYPIPTVTGWNGKIIYSKKPTLLSSSNLSATPELDEDWHLIYVYGAVSEIASIGSTPDIVVSNNYTVKYNNLLKEIKQNRFEKMPKYPVTKDVTRKRRYSKEVVTNAL